MTTYDLLVVGGGPAGIHAALRARRAGKRAAVGERRGSVGGVCVHTGTIPSKTLRQAVMAIDHGAPYTYFLRSVMNYPTLSRVFKVCAWYLWEEIGE